MVGYPCAFGRQTWSRSCSRCGRSFHQWCNHRHYICGTTPIIIRTELVPWLVLRNGSACVEIIAAPQATNVSVQASISLAREFNLESGEFMATRSLVDSPAAIKVDYLTSGSAEPNFDYATLEESVLILPNENFQTFSVAPFPDDEIEGDETVTVTLQPSAHFNLGEPDRATVTIKDLPVDDWRNSSFSEDPNGENANDSADAEGDGLVISWNTLSSWTRMSQTI